MSGCKEGLSIALGVAMLMVLTAAAIHLQSRTEGQSLASRQVDVAPMMSHVRNLPVEPAIIEP
jgi:hypothetical protein